MSIKCGGPLFKLGSWKRGSEQWEKSSEERSGSGAERGQEGECREHLVVVVVKGLPKRHTEKVSLAEEAERAEAPITVRQHKHKNIQLMCVTLWS